MAPTYAEFIKNTLLRARKGNWLVDFDALNGAAASDTLRYCLHTREYRTGSTESPASTPWGSRLIEPPTWSSSLWSGDQLGTRTTPSYGDLRIKNTDGALDSLFDPSAPYEIAGRSVTLRHGSGDGRPSDSEAMLLSDFNTWSLVAGVPQPGLKEVRIPLEGPEARFRSPVEKRRFRGTSWCLHLASGAVATVGTPAALDVTGDLTIEGWFRLDALATNQVLITWDNSATTYPYELRVLTTGEVRFFCTVGGVPQNSTSSGFGVAAGTWYHVRLTADVGASDTTFSWSLYDDSTGAVSTFEESKAFTARDSADGSLTLGKASGGIVGRLDEWRVWNIARDPIAADADRHAPLTLVPSSAVGVWHISDGSGTTVTDASATSADATTSGTVTWYPALSGDDGLAGRLVPAGFGYILRATPVLVHEPDQIYMVNHGAVQEITAVEEGGNAITLGTAYSDLDTFLAATTTGGTYDTLANHGLVRLATAPSLPLLVTFKGENTGGYVNTSGEIIRRLATTRGDDPLSDPGEIDTASFTQIDTDAPGVIGLYYDGSQSVEVGAAIDEASRGAAAYWGFRGGSSKLSVIQYEGAAGAADHSIRGEQILRFEPRQGGVKYRRFEIYFNRSLTALKPNEISGSVSGDDFAKLQREWEVVVVEDTSAPANGPTFRVFTPLRARSAAEDRAAHWRTVINNGYQIFDADVDLGCLEINEGDTVAPSLEIDGGYRYGMDETRFLLVVEVKRQPDKMSLVLRG